MADESPRRALVIAAHPDDAEVGCGGTQAKWAQEGWEVFVLVTTNGAKGSDDPRFSPQQLAAQRVVEQRDASKKLGAREVFFLGHEDGELLYTRELLGQVTRIIREVRPTAIFTHDPEVLIHSWGRDDYHGAIQHSDHRCTGLVALDAVYPTARDRLNFPEQIRDGLEPHKVEELYLWGSNNPNFDVDITDLEELKIEALLCHVSQFPDGSAMFDRWRDRWRGEDGRYRERFRKVIIGF
jgi:LmbE family N-acetylglucosaminyl deacetylase